MSHKPWKWKRTILSEILVYFIITLNSDTLAINHQGRVPPIIYLISYHRQIHIPIIAIWKCTIVGFVNGVLLDLRRHYRIRGRGLKWNSKCHMGNPRGRTVISNVRHKLILKTRFITNWGLLNYCLNPWVPSLSKCRIFNPSYTCCKYLIFTC